MILHTTIMTYGGGLNAFRMNRHLWLAQKPAMGLVICPENDPIPDPETHWPVVAIGESCHMGQGILDRLRYLLRELPKTNATHFLIHEQDSFTLGPTVPELRGFFANVWLNVHPELFISPRYANNPWLIDRDTLILMAQAAERWPDVTELGAADRYFGALAMLANVPLMPHRPQGYSLATITPPFVGAMVAAIERGATMIHGVKHPEVLDAALRAYERSASLRA